jgi:hypothetical protein
MQNRSQPIYTLLFVKSVKGFSRQEWIKHPVSAKWVGVSLFCLRKEKEPVYEMYLFHFIFYMYGKGKDLPLTYHEGTDGGVDI